MSHFTFSIHILYWLIDTIQQLSFICYLSWQSELNAGSPLTLPVHAGMWFPVCKQNEYVRSALPARAFNTVRHIHTCPSEILVFFCFNKTYRDTKISSYEFIWVTNYLLMDSFSSVFQSCSVIIHFTLIYFPLSFSSVSDKQWPLHIILFLLTHTDGQAMDTSVCHSQERIIINPVAGFGCEIEKNTCIYTSGYGYDVPWPTSYERIPLLLLRI